MRLAISLVFLLTTSLLCSADDMMNDIQGRRFRPDTLTLNHVVSFKDLDSRSGRVKVVNIPSGAKVKFRSFDSGNTNTIICQFNDKDVTIPWNWTDIEAQYKLSKQPHAPKNNDRNAEWNNWGTDKVGGGIEFEISEIKANGFISKTQHRYAWPGENKESSKHEFVFIETPTDLLINGIYWHGPVVVVGVRTNAAREQFIHLKDTRTPSP